MRQKIIAIVVLIIALTFLVMGNVRSHKVYDPETAAAGIDAFYRINERQLVVDATFTGDVLRDGKLFSTYDRTKPVGRRACPT
jgi:asparagine N-glycosylation enzyme membrane subunit Stt3